MTEPLPVGQYLSARNEGNTIEAQNRELRLLMQHFFLIADAWKPTPADARKGYSHVLPHMQDDAAAKVEAVLIGST